MSVPLPDNYVDKCTLEEPAECKRAKWDGDYVFQFANAVICKVCPYRKTVQIPEVDE